MPRTIFIGAAIAALSTAAPAWAADAKDSAAPVDEVVVTATRSPDGVRADQLGSAVSVITPEQFEDRQVRIVSDVLRDLPGVAISRAGGIGGQTQVRVRGTEANHVLTLIDGIEAADPFQGEFDFATLLADDVARLELVRGPQSALYGSDAIAGVINYITPTGRESPGGRIRAEAGSEGAFGAAARWGGVSGSVDYVVSGGLQTTDGFVGQTLPGGTRRLGSDLTSLAGKLGYQVNDALKLRAVVRYTGNEADTAASSFGRGQIDSPGSRFRAESLYGFVGGDLALLDGRWTQSASVQIVSAERDGYRATGRASGDEGVRKKASYATTWKIEGGRLNHRLTGALDVERETYQNTSPVSAGADTTRRSIDNLGLVAEYDLAIGDVAGLGAAVRHDDNDFFANATIYKLQGYWKAAEAIRLRAAAGTGIKQPTQTELFGFNATGPFPFRGNVNLIPEKARGWEAGADVSLADGRFTLSATYFRQTLKHEIFSFFGGTGPAGCPVLPAGTSTTCNRAFDSTQRGVELAATAQLLPELSVTGAYTDLSAKENGLEEIRRAPHIGSASVSWKPLDGRATLNLTVRYNGRQLDQNFTGITAPFPAGLPDVRVATGANAGKVILPSFTLVNLNASFDLTDQIEVFGRVENLGKARYYEVFGYPSQPRAAYAGARVRF